MICIWKWQWCESSSSKQCMLDIFYGKVFLHCNCISCLALGMGTRRKYVSETVLFDFQSCSIKDANDSQTLVATKAFETFETV